MTGISVGKLQASSDGPLPKTASNKILRYKDVCWDLLLSLVDQERRDKFTTERLCKSAIRQKATKKKPIMPAEQRVNYSAISLVK